MADPTTEQLLQKLNSLAPEEQRALLAAGQTSGRGLLGEIAARYFGVVSGAGQLATRPVEQQQSVLGAFASSLPQGNPPPAGTPQLHTGIPGVPTTGPGSINIGGQPSGGAGQPVGQTITVGGQPIELPPPPQPPPPGSPPEVLKAYEEAVADYNQQIFSIQLDAAQKAAERAGDLEDALALARARESYADIFAAAREVRAGTSQIAAESRAEEAARKARAETLANDLEVLGRKYGFELDAQNKQQIFQAGESATERALRIQLQQEQIAAQTKEGEAERQLRIKLQQEQITSTTGESALERQIRQQLQTQLLTTQTQEAEADRLFRQMLQQQQGTLQTELLKLQQDFSGTEAEKNRAIERQRVALEQLSLTEATLARKEKTELERQSLSVQKQMAAYDTVIKMVQNPLTFAIYRQAGGLFSSLGSEFAGLDTVPVPTETTEQNLARWQARSQFSKEAPGVQGQPAQPSTVLPSGAAVLPASAPLTRGTTPPPPTTPPALPTIPTPAAQPLGQPSQPVFQPQAAQPQAQPTATPPAPVFDPHGIGINPGEQLIGGPVARPGSFGPGIDASTALPNQVFTIQGAQNQRESVLTGFNTLIGPYILPRTDLGLSPEELAQKYPKVSADQWREATGR